jgi:hypothetical protein
LDGGDPTLTFVCYPSLTADAHNHVVVMHAVDEVSEGVGVYLGVRVDLGGAGVDPSIWADDHRKSVDRRHSPSAPPQSSQE